MSERRIELLLLAASPTRAGTQAFTDSVMAKIAQQSPPRKVVESIQTSGGLWVRLRHLPRIAIMLLALAALLTVSGTVYAAYLLWPKPQTTTSTPLVNHEGRMQLEASFAQCGNKPSSRSYELKKDAPVTSDKIPMIVQARCELDTIDRWVKEQFPEYYAGGHINKGKNSGATIQPYDSVSPSTSMATHLLNSDKASVTFEGLQKYNLADKTLAITPKTRFIAGGRQVDRDAIPTGSVVVFVTKQTARVVPGPDCDKMHCSMQYENLREELFAVIKLDLPFESYDQLAWQSLAERTPCIHNEQDTCVANGSIDLYMANGAELQGNQNLVYKQIEGKLSGIQQDRFSIITTSGRTFTVVMGSDILTQFNQQRSEAYGVTIGQDDVVEVGYYAPEADASQTIARSVVQRVVLKLELVGKSDPVKKY